MMTIARIMKPIPARRSERHSGRLDERKSKRGSETGPQRLHSTRLFNYCRQEKTLLSGAFFPKKIIIQKPILGVHSECGTVFPGLCLCSSVVVVVVQV